MTRNWTLKTSMYLVFAIAAIAFMMYSMFSIAPREPSTFQGSLPSKDLKKTNYEKETFDLLPIKKDPFFSIKKEKGTNKIKLKKKEIVSWPTIRYNGMIESGSGKDKLFVLMINNRQQLLEKGTVAEDVKLLHGTSEEVTVLFQGETKEISQ